MEPCAPPPPNAVNKCYMFKSRLQEYAQKAGFTTPVYQTVKDGASHDPEFRSTVVVNGVNYDSLPKFCTRKEAEQSAAEVALVEILRSGQMADRVPSVHETGLCKNLLQEYAQKMNYAIPSYNCTKQGVGPGSYICTVDIGGIQYIGASARTKKEAEIKAARTAFLAIQRLERGKNGESQYTVLPVRKENNTEVKKIKPKKKKFKKKWINKKKWLQQKNGENVPTEENIPSGENIPNGGNISTGENIPNGEDVMNGEDLGVNEEKEEKRMVSCEKDLGLGFVKCENSLGFREEKEEEKVISCEKNLGLGLGLGLGSGEEVKQENEVINCDSNLGLLGVNEVNDEKMINSDSNLGLGFNEVKQEENIVSCDSNLGLIEEQKLVNFETNSELVGVNNCDSNSGL